MGSQTHTASNAYAYRASKAGANNITLTLSHELHDEGIAVAAFHPGWVRTDMGGVEAKYEVSESVKLFLSQIAQLPSSANGIFMGEDGEIIPW